MACVFGAQGQYSTQTTATPANQYYTMPTGPAPSTHISAPTQVNVASAVPANLYLGTQNQEVPYSEYTSNPVNAGINSLWIQGTTSWTQYATVPQGASVSLIAISTTGGSGYLSEMHPDGTMSSSNLYFYPGSSNMNFYADSIGRHVLSFVINGKMSNTVIIDVTGTYVPPSNYLPPRYYPYYGYGFPSSVGFGEEGGRVTTVHEPTETTTETQTVSESQTTGGETEGHTTGEGTEVHTTGKENGGKK